MILPPAMLGILGGGQLGRYFTLAARDMGYRVMVLDPDDDCPAASVADVFLAAAYDDATALAELARQCAAVTTEFESVPAAALRQLARRVPVHPGPEAVAICQDRAREKAFLAEHGLPHAPWARIDCEADLAALPATLFPAILKRSREGYDGKGQARVADLDAAIVAFRELGNVPCVLEQRLALQTELSVVLARGADGQLASYPASENSHREGILDMSVAPAHRLPAAMQAEACRLAERIATALDYVGTLAVEFFVVDRRLLVNEIAPRPHNSGHWTLDACASSQFEQQVRALCGLPLADTTPHAAAVMVNLLGGLWPAPEHLPDFSVALREPALKLHLYGKRQARAGRKMGHFTVLGTDAPSALYAAARVRAEIGLDAG